MNCDPCSKACKLPICADNINLGQIEAFDTDVTVVFTELITGRKRSVEATSDEAGNLIVDVTDIKDFFSPNFIYSIGVFSAVTNACPDITLIVNDIPVSCVEVDFFVTDTDVETSVLQLQDTSGTLDDGNGDPLLDEHFNPLES